MNDYSGVIRCAHSPSMITGFKNTLLAPSDKAMIRKMLDLSHEY